MKYDPKVMQANSGLYHGGGRSPGLNERLNGLPAASSGYKDPHAGMYSSINAKVKN
jgi:hypothetical protein